MRDIARENRELQARLTKERGRLPGAQGLGDGMLTVDEAAELLGTTERQALDAIPGDAWATDSVGRPCIGQQDFDAYVVKAAGGGLPKGPERQSIFEAQ